jgi:hypothetical protein
MLGQLTVERLDRLREVGDKARQPSVLGLALVDAGGGEEVDIRGDALLPPLTDLAQWVTEQSGAPRSGCYTPCNADIPTHSKKSLEERR